MFCFPFFLPSKINKAFFVAVSYTQIRKKIFVLCAPATLLSQISWQMEPTLKLPLPLPATQQPDTLKSMYI